MYGIVEVSLNPAGQPESGPRTPGRMRTELGATRTCAVGWPEEQRRVVGRMYWRVESWETPKLLDEASEPQRNVRGLGGLAHAPL